MVAIKPKLGFNGCVSEVKGEIHVPLQPLHMTGGDHFSVDAVSEGKALSVCNARHLQIFTAPPYNVSLYCPIKHFSLAMIFVLLVGHDFTYTNVQ